MDRFKTFNATGIAPNGRLYAGDLNLFQDLVAALSDLTQNIEASSITIGESGLAISKYGTAEFQLAGAARVTGILRAMAGFVTASYTTTARNALVNPPAVMMIFNSTVGEFQWNSGTPSVPVWSSLVPVFGAGSIVTSMIADGAITTVKIADKAVTAPKLADNLRPSQSAIPSDEALRALGTTADKAAAGDDARLSDLRTPLDGSVTAAKVNAALKPSGTAVDATEALRALGMTAGKAAAGDDARFFTGKIATTVAGLGTGVDGELGILVLSTTPYKFMFVYFSASYGKWISEEKSIGGEAESGTTSGAFDIMATDGHGGGEPLWGILTPWRILNAAGLVPMIQFIAKQMAVGGNTATARAGYAATDSGAAFPTLTTIAATELVESGNGTYRVKSSAFVPPWAVQPTLKDFLLFGAANKSGNGSSNVSMIPYINLRWEG